MLVLRLLRSPLPSPFTLAAPGRVRTSHALERGVGLIEVMVAVLILSIGFLGVAALLSRSMSTNNSAMQRSMATIATYSILDAMRADLTNAKALAYNTSTPIKATSCTAPTTPTMVTSQLYDWCEQLKQNLGDSATTTGSISCATTGACTITISYDDSRAGWGSGNSQGGNTQTVVTNAIL